MKLMSQGLWRTIAVLAVIFAMSAFVFGQAELGAIAGVVKDSTGAVVADAKVTATLTSTNAEHSATSNSLGEYHLQNLTPGTYSVVVSKSGFQTYKTTMEVAVGAHATLDASLTVGSGSTVVEVVAGAATEINTQTQELSQLIDTQQLAQLPSLTRNPYDFVAISGNVSNGDTTSNGGMGGGQELSNRGVGFAINGQRESGTEILLDGVENVSVFGVSVGENIPLDGVQEYSVITNNFSAEYGRASGGVVNVSTKAGSNGWHGSAWEFNRLAAYTANTFNNVANDLPKGQYTRNQFGFQVGGPILKNKLFVSESTEWTRVRSNSIQTEEIFDPSFLALLPANAQSYFSSFGTTSLASAGVASTWGGNNDGGWVGTWVNSTSNSCFFGTNLTNTACVNPLLNGTTQIADGQAVMDTVNFSVPFNAGGGSPQNTYTLVGRLDYNLSDKTQMFFRAARERDDFFNGTASFSAYPQYDVGSLNTNQSYLYSINHTFSASLLNNAKVSFTRFNSINSFDQSLTFVPNLMFTSPVDPVTSQTIQMPGLENASEPGLGGLPFGGPQNTLQAEDDISWTKGRHSMKFGGQFTYIQLNVAYGAYQQAVEQLGSTGSDSMQDLINVAGNPLGSQLAGNGFAARVNPQGVTTKTGTNAWHGSAWEFNRLAAYTANTFNNVANGLPKGQYTRNQFGFQVGGPVIKNKLFVSESTEWTRVRSNSVQTEEVFDPQFISYLPQNAQDYFNSFATGAFAAAPSSGVAATVAQLDATTGAGSIFVNNVNNVTPIPLSTPVFDTVQFQVPFNDGGGPPQNTYTLVGRLDYDLSTQTQMFFRAARERDDFFNGTNSYSAYPAYDTGGLNQNQSYLFSLNHTFNANLLNNTKVSFTRFNSITSYSAPTNTPNLMFISPTDPVTNGVIQMPGLENASAPGAGGLPFGGPQNTLQFEHDLSWTKGRHNMKFGGQFTYIQLNVAYGAYAQAVEALGGSGQDSMDDLVNSVGNMNGTDCGGGPSPCFASQLAGQGFAARVNPQGVLPCHTDINGNVIDVPSCEVTPPLSSASYGRSYRYKDWAIYGQDSFRITPRLTLNYGLRWEHYGVQHNNKADLDSNFYYGSGSGQYEQVRNGEVEIADQSSIGQFWSPSWGTFAPRVGFAYDIFGDGKSSLRGGFGISYERNFGNVTYNASFNPPASAVVASTCAARSTGCTTLVTNDDLGPLGLPGARHHYLRQKSACQIPISTPHKPNFGACHCSAK